MLELTGVCAGYGDSMVIRHLSLSVPEHESIGLLGINGAGKTTLLHAIMGFVRVREGRIRFRGHDITRLPSYEIVRLGIALVPQGRRVFPQLTVRENLLLGHRNGLAGRWKLDDVLVLFPKLRERLSHSGGQLSGGEQQMVAWARALMTNPVLMLMDEPTEGLSPLLVRSLRDVVSRLRGEGATLLLAEQNIEFACDITDRISVLVNGNITREFTREQLQTEQTAGQNIAIRLADIVQGFKESAQ